MEKKPNSIELIRHKQNVLLNDAFGDEAVKREAQAARVLNSLSRKKGHGEANWHRVAAIPTRVYYYMVEKYGEEIFSDPKQLKEIMALPEMQPFLTTSLQNL